MNIHQEVELLDCPYCGGAALLEEENEAVAAAFLAGHPDFSLEAFTLPGPIGTVEGGQCTLWPQQTGTDGFFIARLRRGA